MKSELFTTRWSEIFPGEPLQNPKKMVLFIMWGSKDIVYYELLLQNQFLYSDNYYSQLDRLQALIDEKLGATRL